eukprot:12707318-Alexandrium_andersonii.AAC.1
MAGSASAAAEPMVWIHNVTCDGCGKVIEGKFQTCSTCGSVDLCLKCFPKRKQLHPEHSDWHRGA